MDFVLMLSRSSPPEWLSQTTPLIVPRVFPAHFACLFPPCAHVYRFSKSWQVARQQQSTQAQTKRRHESLLPIGLMECFRSIRCRRCLHISKINGGKYL